MTIELSRKLPPKLPPAPSLAISPATSPAEITTSEDRDLGVAINLTLDLTIDLDLDLGGIRAGLARDLADLPVDLNLPAEHGGCGAGLARNRDGGGRLDTYIAIASMPKVIAGLQHGHRSARVQLATHGCMSAGACVEREERLEPPLKLPLSSVASTAARIASTRAAPLRILSMVCEALRRLAPVVGVGVRVMVRAKAS